jgi:hypothetical protein
VVITGEHVIYVAFDLSVPSVDIRVDGVAIPMTDSTSLVAGTGLLRLNRLSGIMAGETGATPVNLEVAAFFLETGTVRAPTLFYDGGAKSFDGIGSPQVYLGGGMTANEFSGNAAQGWNDSYNRGSITVTTASATYT